MYMQSQLSASVADKLVWLNAVVSTACTLHAETSDCFERVQVQFTHSFTVKVG